MPGEGMGMTSPLRAHALQSDVGIITLIGVKVSLMIKQGRKVALCGLELQRWAERYIILSVGLGGAFSRG